VRLAAGDVAGAIGDYDHVLAVAPGHVRARYNRAVAREYQHDVPGALADMDALLAVSPDYAYAYAMRGRYRATLGDVDGALRDWERALALLPAGSADARTVEGYRAGLRARLPVTQR
jgi:tetratricopeptide (TPR) repeat protein